MREGIDKFLKRLRNGPEPEPDAKSLVDAAHHDADPTTFSPLPLRNLQPLHGRHNTHQYKVVAEAGSPDQPYIDIGDKYPMGWGIPGAGNKFFMERPNAATERAVALMVKGIINVSDIVQGRRKKEFYSKVMPIEKIESTASPEEADADVMIFQRIFSDMDHYGGVMGGSKSPHNIEYDKEGRMAHFDFSRAKFLFFEHDDPRIELNMSGPFVLSEAAQLILSKKIDLLLERVQGADGRRFLEAVLKNVGQPVFSLFKPISDEMRASRDPIGLLQETLVSRLEKMKAELNEEGEKGV